MDTTALAAAYDALLDAATTVADGAPPPDEWTADEIVAHVALVTAATIATAAAVAAGAHTTYDNRLAQDTWTINRVIALADGPTGLRERIRSQGEALCTLAGPTLSETELDTSVPALLLSHDTALVNGPVALRDIITGLAEVELPGHTRQLLALSPSARTEVRPSS
ncbi:hypothetical protein AB0C29_20480 [Actinoplanes sp. NPDC048791]|uniref:hypothetical protein n=1 Tax=Actinoplanes sp. NPDC048791 TaxID=3154623 RepID=UPI0033F3FD97